MLKFILLCQPKKTEKRNMLKLLGSNDEQQQNQVEYI